MADLYIIAAGKGSRMGGSIPKALVPITDLPNLTTTLQQIGSKFTNVFVVTNTEIQTPWEEYFKNLEEQFPEIAKNVFNQPIYSGRGDGHAVMKALWESDPVYWPKERRPQDLSDDIVIAWGDVFFRDGRIIDELLAKPMAIGMVPVVKEENPYVALELDIPFKQEYYTINTWGPGPAPTTHSQMGMEHQEHGYPIMFAKFSKFGEIEEGEVGYHDQSVFRFSREHLENTLDALDEVMDRNGKYISPNGELSLLYTFHYLANHQAPVHAYETQYPTMSFNTVEEVAQIQQEIHQKWKAENRSS